MGMGRIYYPPERRKPIFPNLTLENLVLSILDLGSKKLDNTLPSNKPQDGGNLSRFDGAAAKESGNFFVEKLLKLIPIEIVTFYSALVPLLTGLNENYRQTVALGSIAVSVLANYLYLYKLADPTKKSFSQISFSCIAFLVWAYHISGQILAPSIYEPTISVIIVMGASLLFSFIPTPR
jgi:hypothetical protein